MANSRVLIPITWNSGAGSVTLNNANQIASDVFTLDVNDFEADVELLVDNQGTPATGDVVNVRVALTVGDLDTGGDDYATPKHSESIGQLDTVAEDPAAFVRPMRTACGAGKLYVDAPQGASRNIVVKAAIKVHRVG